MVKLTDNDCIDDLALPQCTDFQPPLPENYYVSVIDILRECCSACQNALAATQHPAADPAFPSAYLKHLYACSEVCEFTARMLLKGNAGAGLLYGIATRICWQCADSCERVEEPSLQGIAELCRKTAAACVQESSSINQQVA